MTDFCRRITPLPVKCGDLLFLSTTPECYRSYVSVETVVLSMLFNKDLKVPDSRSATQLKNREKAKAANPFTLRATIAKEKKAAEKVEQRWAPVIETFSQVDQASLAATTGYYGSKKVIAVCLFLLGQISLIRSLSLFKAAVADATKETDSDDSLSKALDPASSGKDPVPVTAVVDEILQRPVDVRRLVPSGGTGPPKRRHHPSKESRQPKARKVFLFIVD